MKKIIVFLFLIGCFGLNSCEYKGSTMSLNKIYFNNNTNHVIKFLPYKNGSIITDSIKVFAHNTVTFLESLEINGRGSGSSTFTNKYMNKTDSVIVTFDGIKKEKHQFIPVSSAAAFIFLPSKERSIFSPSDAFNLKVIEQRKGYLESEYTYTFTEQDYLDAEFF